jgi:hypothetical protein
MQSPHSPAVIDLGDGTCLVECPQCRAGRVKDVPIGIGLPMLDRVTAELLTENHRDDHRRFVPGRRLAAVSTR